MTSEALVEVNPKPIPERDPWVTLQSASTKDKTQRKRLESNIVTGGWRVRRAYPGEAWTPVLEDSEAECTRVYEGMS